MLQLHPPRRRKGPPRGFTLIELLVAIGISVVLLSILGLVFQVATTAARKANSRASLTERLRALNIRIRQEISGMVHAARANGTTYEIRDAFGKTANVFVFTTATVQDGRAMTVDVAYVWKPGPDTNREQGRFIRLRDRTGPQADQSPVEETITGQAVSIYYTLGDDRWIAKNLAANEAISLDNLLADMDFDSRIYLSDIVMENVRSMRFSVVDKPPSPAKAAELLHPRTLPAGVRLEISYGPEVGEIDMIEATELLCAVPRGL